MRNYMITVALALAGLAGCTMAMGGETDDADGTGDADGAGDADGTSDGVDGAGWTAVALVDDESDPGDPVFHAGNDRVVGMHFTSPSTGLVITQGSEQTFGDGGAVFRITDDTATIAFSGHDAALTKTGSVDFFALEPTPSGFIATSHASDIITSTDGGATWSIRENGTSFGIEAVLAARQTATGITIVRQSGAIDTASSAPGPNTGYTTVWAPEALPSVPIDVPADQCQGAPFGAGSPTTHDSVYVSADRSVVAYTSNPFVEPEVCISTDGGRTFYPHILATPEESENYVPTGVTFTSATTGIAWFGTRSVAGTYIRRTTDGGATWTAIALPADLEGKAVELPAGYFLPDGQHGWLAGYDFDGRHAVLLATTDGGVTWTSDPTVGAAVDRAGGSKLYSVFATDPDHVWIGGERGLLMRN